MKKVIYFILVALIPMIIVILAGAAEPKAPTIFNCFVYNVVDGDTLDATCNLGFGIYKQDRFRLYGIDTPESRTRNLEEKKMGLEVKAYLKGRLEGRLVKIEVKKEGKFGRPVSDVWTSSQNINQLLIETHRALEYYGERKNPDIVGTLKRRRSE